MEIKIFVAFIARYKKKKKKNTGFGQGNKKLKRDWK